MVAWLNRVIYQFPRDATAVTTVNPASAANVVSGTPFTPQAGRKLVVVMEAPVTSTGTSGGGGSTAPAGWSGGAAAAGYNAVNATGLYLFHKDASGSDTLVAYHNAANYPVFAAVYEFPPGSSIVAAVAATGISYTAANPNVTGLTPPRLVMAAKVASMGSGGGTPTFSAAWAGAGTPIEDVDVFAVYSTTDGYGASIAYVENHAATSWQPTATISNTHGDGSSEALTWAILVSSGLSANPTDTVGITDVVTAVKSGAGLASVADTIGVTDAVTAIKSKSVSITDAVAATDTGNPIEIGIEAVVSELVGVTDTASRATTMTRTPADVIGATDTALAAAGVVRDVVDGVGAADTVDASSAASGSVNPADTAVASDAVVSSMVRSVDASDAVAASDAAAVVVGSSRALSESVGVSDTVTAVLISAGTVTASDQVQVTDVATTSTMTERTVSDAVEVTDEVTVTLVKPGGAAAIDIVNVSDAVTVTLSRVRSIVDAVGVRDAVTVPTGLPAVPRNRTLVGYAPDRTLSGRIASIGEGAAT